MGENVRTRHAVQVALLAALLLGLLGACVWALAWAFGHAPVAISIHGWVALGLGCVASLALGGGLMALSFFSARRGYDDDADARAHTENIAGQD